ncbi:CCR4-NOT transcription complex subunit 1-like isoform X1 [Bicyclus anynana]|uniref:CCR4-NOT transcription complex subunit 1-like isoform X1 n=1 Tax=Bicyclus anynana TaxID=110368 RepID=A0ABM3LZ24_BICAN|nr:CCR4-NOT transcription complex subunit 1-like isoform X1 [Bicyclus anynana]
MNLDPLTFSLSQINCLVANLNKKNFKQVNRELTQIISLYGSEAERRVLRCLLAEAAKGIESDAPSGAAGAAAALLAQQLAGLLDHPAKATLVCSVLDDPPEAVQKVVITDALKPSNTLFSRFARLLKFTVAQEIAFSLVLKNSSLRPDVATLAERHLNERLLDFVRCYLDADRGHEAEVAGVRECGPGVLQPLLTRLPAGPRRALLQRLRAALPRDAAPVLLAPLLYADDTRAPPRRAAARAELAAAMAHRSLADGVRELGYRFTASADDCRSFLADLGARRPAPADVARAVAAMVRYDGAREPPGAAWDADAFARAVRDAAPELDWRDVVPQLDHPDFLVPDRRGLGALVALLRAGLRDAIPADALLRPWANLDGQLSLVSHALRHPDVFSFAEHPVRQVAVDALKAPPEADDREAATWRCLPLLELLLHAAERGRDVRELLEPPARRCPDVLLLALLALGPPACALGRELLATLVPVFLAGHPNAGALLQLAWHAPGAAARPALLHAMAEWHARGDGDQARLSRALDVAQELKALSALLDVRAFPFAIELACLAARREYLKLDKWLADKLAEHGESFAAAALQLLRRRRAPDDAALAAGLRLCAPAAPPELRDAILGALAAREPWPGAFAPQLDAVAGLAPGFAGLSLSAPAFASAGAPGSPASFAAIPMPPAAPEDAGRFLAAPASKDVEDEASGYFQRIYNRPPTLSVEEALDVLSAFGESAAPREREVFSCMLRNLFEEYKFFPQYPDADLRTNAQLFGGVLARGALPPDAAALALRLVLDALRKPEGSKMFRFGVAALDRFKARLKDYHKYCEHVRAIPHFRELPPHLVEYVECGARGREPAPEPPAHRPAAYAPGAAEPAAGRPSIANATNIDTLLSAADAERPAAPPEPVRDKTAFIFNNLSQLNLPAKCAELRELVAEEHYEWLAQYVVMKRASIELNFHALYASLLDELGARALRRLVARETYRNIGVLLRSEKGIANFSDRSLLKNLGHWLGVLTLARCRPVLQRELDLKTLLLEAYHRGQRELLYIVPFTAKVLESCARSAVFKPPNPWTMALMGVLAELHREPGLKLNLKFEIEVLCKKLSLDISELKPSLYLRDPEKLKTIEFQCSRPDVAPEPAPPPPPAEPAPAAPPPAPRFSYADVDVSSTAALGRELAGGAHVALLQSHPQLQPAARAAVERAVQEWIHPVVDRSIKYALTTSERLIRKDFAADPDETRMRTCAHHLMRNLTAGMAMITCREQILATVSANLKAAFGAALAPSGALQKDVVESAAAALAAENAELACAFIQKTAVEKALPELDKRLADEYERRELARREGRGLGPAPGAERLPERVRVRAGGAPAERLAVYEQFACNIPGFAPLPCAPPPPPPPPPPTQAFGRDASALLGAVQAFLAGAAPLPALAPLAALALRLHDALALAGRGQDLALLQTAVEGLLGGRVRGAEHAEQLARFRELHVRALRLLADAGGRAWLREHAARAAAAAPDDLRYNLEAVDCLVRNQLLDLPQYDAALAQLMDDGNNFAAVAFVTQLLRLYLHDEREPACAPDALRRCTDALLRAARPPAPPPAPAAHLHDGVLLARRDEPAGARDAADALLGEWRALAAGARADGELARHFPAFVQRMSARGVLQSDAALARFLRLGAEQCARHVRRLLAAGAERAACHAPCDAFVRLVALLVKNTADAADPTPKLNLLNKVRQRVRRVRRLPRAVRRLRAPRGAARQEHGRRGRPHAQAQLAQQGTPARAPRAPPATRRATPSCASWRCSSRTRPTRPTPRPSSTCSTRRWAS